MSDRENSRITLQYRIVLHREIKECHNVNRCFICELLHSVSNSTTVLLEARRVVLGWRMGLIEMSLSIHILMFHLGRLSISSSISSRISRKNVIISIRCFIM